MDGKYWAIYWLLIPSKIWWPGFPSLAISRRLKSRISQSHILEFNQARHPQVIVYVIRVAITDRHRKFCYLCLHPPTHLHLVLSFPTSTLLRQTWQPYIKLHRHTASLAQHLVHPRSAPQQVLKTALAASLGSMTFGLSTILQMCRWKIKRMLQESHLQYPPGRWALREATAIKVASPPERTRWQGNSQKRKRKISCESLTLASCCFPSSIMRYIWPNSIYGNSI